MIFKTHRGTLDKTSRKISVKASMKSKCERGEKKLQEEVEKGLWSDLSNLRKLTPKQLKNLELQKKGLLKR